MLKTGPGRSPLPAELYYQDQEALACTGRPWKSFIWGLLCARDTQRESDCLGLRCTTLPEKPRPACSSYTELRGAGFWHRARGAFHQLAALPAQTSWRADLWLRWVTTHRVSVTGICPVTLLVPAAGWVPWKGSLQNAALGQLSSPRLFCTDA